ncbi:aspartate 1-decarboxylase [Clostridium botulinum]|nr:aspartate 1-decarboxylase [Clostridium botulinum]NFI52323.1 aspartate 1-decarboxylase [Clostridium botulinum]
MRLNMLKAKIHRAMVTEANLNYVGSITIDIELMEQSGIIEYEKVQIVDIDNGARFETYVIAGEKNSGVICLNGAAARCVQKGDRVIIMAYCEIDKNEVDKHEPKVVFVDNFNRVREILYYEKHGQIR